MCLTQRIPYSITITIIEDNRGIHKVRTETGPIPGTYHTLDQENIKTRVIYSRFLTETH